MKIISAFKEAFSNHTLRFLVLLYWFVYWLFNSFDKVIGGSQFLWVGKDRFALFERLFASAGWGSPVIANVALILVTALEIFAFLFFTGAFIYLLQKKQGLCRSWFVAGTVITLSIFGLFSIGDQLFGDHVELLEHAIYWIISLFSWVVFSQAEKMVFQPATPISKQQTVFSGMLFLGIALLVNVSIFVHKASAFHERKDGVVAEQKGENLYRCAFPFLAGSTSFENTIALFQRRHPEKKIVQIYTVPDELRNQQADALVVYITTADRP